jgi:hypothetical protein
LVLVIKPEPELGLIFGTRFSVYLFKKQKQTRTGIFEKKMEFS